MFDALKDTFLYFFLSCTFLSDKLNSCYFWLSRRLGPKRSLDLFCKKVLAASRSDCPLKASSYTQALSVLASMSFDITQFLSLCRFFELEEVPRSLQVSLLFSAELLGSLRLAGELPLSVLLEIHALPATQRVWLEIFRSFGDQTVEDFLDFCGFYEGEHLFPKTSEVLFRIGERFEADSRRVRKQREKAFAFYASLSAAPLPEEARQKIFEKAFDGLRSEVDQAYYLDGALSAGFSVKKVLRSLPDDFLLKFFHYTRKTSQFLQELGRASEEKLDTLSRAKLHFLYFRGFEASTLGAVLALRRAGFDLERSLVLPRNWSLLDLAAFTGDLKGVQYFADEASEEELRSTLKKCKFFDPRVKNICSFYLKQLDRPALGEK